MDFITQVLDSARGGATARRFDPAALLKFTELHPQVQRHLSRVYVTLFAAVLVCAAGCVAGNYIPWVLPVSSLVALGCMIGLAITPATAYNNNKRYGMLGGFAFAQGCTLTPLVSLASAAYPGAVLSALLGAAAVFLCFSGSALLSPRRSFLFLAGTLSSALLALLALRASAWLLAWAGLGGLAFTTELYLGLLAFSGYVLYDTQLIVERAYAGEMDVVRHAQDLFIDAVAIFVRLLVILMRSAAKKQEEEERRQRRSRTRR